MRQSEKIAQEIAEMEERMEQLRRDRTIAEQAEATEDPSCDLARTLHSKICRQNHTDGCGWFYETSNKIDDWTGRDHIFWLNKARELEREFGSAEAAEKAIGIFSKLGL